MKTVLDIGCGSKPWGNINLDLFLGANQHHKYDYDPKEIEKFVSGDGSRLPYRDKSIDIIVSRQCLEHIPEPLLAIRDWERVAKKAVVITVPNSPSLEEHREHLYSWSLISFENFLSQVFPSVMVWPNAPIEAMNKNRALNKLFKIKLLKNPLQRLISRWWGLQLTAICYCGDLGKEEQEVYPGQNIPLEPYPVFLST